MIRFEGTLTPKIYRRALAVGGRRMQFFAALWIGVGIIGLSSAQLERPASWGLPLFFLLFGVFALLLPGITVKRAFATDRFLSEPITGEADEQSVRMEQPHGRTDLPWAMMHKVMMTPKLVTVYQSAHIMRIFPREFFADEESWEGFRRLTSAAPTAAKVSPRLLRTFLLWIAIIIAVFLLWSLYQRT